MDEIILLNYLRGECNDDECCFVEEWCERAPENRKMLEQLYYTLFLGERIAFMDAVDTESSLRKFKSTLRSMEKNSRRKSYFLHWKRSLTVAAAFLTGLIFAGGITLWAVSDKLSDYTIGTAPGQRAQTILPDGSTVWLNASTKLIYHNSFWKTDRQIDLDGEAYFEVNHNEYKPFIVNSKEIKTCVLGTKFNVRARDEENRVVTTLFEGKVRVDTPLTKDDGYLLKPGQTLNINTSTYRAELIEYTQPSDILLWINGRLVFEQRSLLEITNVMEKLYDIYFIYEDESLKSMNFTGNFSTDNTSEEILNILSHTNHFKFKKEGRAIRLIKNK